MTGDRHLLNLASLGRDANDLLGCEVNKVFHLLNLTKCVEPELCIGGVRVGGVAAGRLAIRLPGPLHPPERPVGIVKNGVHCFACDGGHCVGGGGQGDSEENEK